MSDQSQPTQPTQRPLSLLTYGPLNILVLEHGPEIGISIRRVGNSNIIPLVEIPALIEMLKGIISPSISIQEYKTAAPTESTAPEEAR